MDVKKCSRAAANKSLDARRNSRFHDARLYSSGIVSARVNSALSLYHH